MSQDDRIGIFESYSDFERQRGARRCFKQVVEAYVNARNTPPIVAISYDPSRRNHKLDAHTIHYLCDVENASRQALGKSRELFHQWQRLVRGEDVPNANSIITRCGRLYQARQLAPHLYFRTVKRGRERGQDVATAIRANESKDGQ